MKYPDITVKLTDTDGHVFSIIGAVIVTLRENGVVEDELNQFSREAMSSDKNNALATCMEWVNVTYDA